MACLVPGWIFEPFSCFHLDTFAIVLPLRLSFISYCCDPFGPVRFLPRTKGSALVWHLPLSFHIL
jgi:hypothetical protein